MNFEQWLAGKGFNLADLNPAQEQTLRSMYTMESNLPKAKLLPEPVPATPAPAPASNAPFSEKLAAIEAEAVRQDTINRMAAEAMQQHRNNPDKVRQLRELAQSACADETCDVRKFENSLIKASRFDGPIIYATSRPEINAEILEAAICQTHRLKDVEKKFAPQVLEQAHKAFKGRLTLKGLLGIAAKQNSGYHGITSDEHALCRAAFANHHSGPSMGGLGPSGIDVTGILSNTANKFLTAGFLYTEQAWREWCKIRPVSDFKQITTYRMTGAAKFVKVAPGGEIPHGTLGELSYTNQAETYGRMLGVSRQDIINDDLGAFTQAAFELSRGAGDSLNEVVYTEWLDDSAFFPTDGSYSNYDAGATDSVLSLAGLDNANTIFKAQTKPDGTPLGAMPQILLVPSALEATAKTLMGATGLVGGSTTNAPNINPWAGMFRVVPSLYLSSTAITGYSATAWYLLADPMNIPGMEIVFLNGVESPTVEYGEFNFNQLGLLMRAYLDFGCNKQEYRCGVKLKGAA